MFNIDLEICKLNIKNIVAFLIGMCYYLMCLSSDDLNF